MRTLTEHERAALLVSTWWSLKLLERPFAAASTELELLNKHGIIVSGEPKLPGRSDVMSAIDLVEWYLKTDAEWCVDELEFFYGITLARVAEEKQ